jgi:hypothetical protein
MPLQTMKKRTQPMTANDVYFRLHDWPVEMDLRAFNIKLQGLVMDFYKELGWKPFPYYGYMPRGLQVRGFYKRVNRNWELMLSYDSILTCLEIAGVNIFHLGGTSWKWTTAAL